MAVPAFVIHKEPTSLLRRDAPLAATQTFLAGAPVRMVSNQLATSVADGTEILVAECVGFAIEPATGITAGSRATNTANGFGAVTNDKRTYIPFSTPGLQIKTKNFWVTTAAGTLAVPDTANIGLTYQISAESATNNWGVEETAAVAGTDLGAFIVDVLDANEVSIRVSGGTGVWVVFAPATLGAEIQGA